MSGWVTVAREEEVPVGGCRLVEVEGTEVALLHLPDGWHAVENLCTHDYAELVTDGHCRLEGAPGREALVCPRHGARFCPRTGRALTPPAYEDLAVFEVRVVEGQVQVRDPRWS